MSPCLQTLPPDFSIYELVQHMRTQRPSVVQTKVAVASFCLLLPLIRRNNGLCKNILHYSTYIYGDSFKGSLLYYFPFFFIVFFFIVNICVTFAKLGAIWAGLQNRQVPVWEIFAVVGFSGLSKQGKHGGETSNRQIFLKFLPIGAWTVFIILCFDYFNTFTHKEVQRNGVTADNAVDWIENNTRKCRTKCG